jgi:organic radical activating enzyme
MEGIINNLETGGLIVTYNCNSKCAHCVRSSSPTRDNKYIDSEMLQKSILKLKEVNCKSLHIEGGEPFLHPDKLIKTVSILHKNKIALEHIVTNAFWYRNSNDTTQILKQLQEFGLSTLLVKVSAFQNEFVPLNKVKRLVETADKVGINSLIWDAESYPEVACFDPGKTHTLKEYQKKFGEDYIRNMSSRFSLTLSGRAYNLFNKHMSKIPLNEIVKNGLGCKHEFTSKHHFHVDLYGNYIFPHTKGLTINVDDINKPLDAKKYPFLSVILTDGINGLYQLATRQYHFVPFQEYISKCHLCYHIREYLVSIQKINSPDLQPVDLYCID